MYSNKTISFADFMTQLHQRVKDLNNYSVRIFFESFLLDVLPKALKERCQSDWDDIVSASDFDVVYPMAANILHAAATRNASEIHDEVYQDASAVSRVFCDLINEIFECTDDDLFEFLEIKSYSQMMAEAGLVTISAGSGGSPVIALTEKGKEVAQEFQKGDQDSFAE